MASGSGGNGNSNANNTWTTTGTPDFLNENDPDSGIFRLLGQVDDEPPQSLVDAIPGLQPLYPRNSNLYTYITGLDRMSTKFRNIRLFAMAAVAAPDWYRLARLMGVWNGVVHEATPVPRESPMYPHMKHVLLADAFYKDLIRWMYEDRLLPPDGQTGAFVNRTEQIRRKLEDLKRSEVHLAADNHDHSWLGRTCWEIRSGWDSMEQAFATLGDSPGETYALAAFDRIPAHTQLLGILVGTEILWELIMDTRHFLGQHFSKRFFLFHADEIVNWNVYYLQNVKNDMNEFLEKEVRAIQNIMRRTYICRFWRECLANAPWQQLYLVMDFPNGSAQARAIDEVNGLLSQNANAARIFKVHPIRKQAVGSESMCVICCEEYQHQDLLLHTWCGHTYHASCIYKFWDEAMTKPFSCPTCRAQCKTPNTYGGLNIEDPHPPPTGYDLTREETEREQVMQWLELNPEMMPQWQVKYIMMREYRKIQIEQDKVDLIGKHRTYDWWPIDFDEVLRWDEDE